MLPVSNSIKVTHCEEAKRARGELGAEYKVQTVAGKVSVWDSQTKSAINLVLIHGNSACKEVFAPLFKSLSDAHRIIALDLPGHGESDDSAQPEIHYSLQALALTIQEVVRSLDLPNYYVMGWSLGGHIAIEMLCDPLLKGIIISGTPPIVMDGEGVKKGFYEKMKLEYLPADLKTQELLPLLMKETPFEKEEAALFHAYGDMDTFHDEKLSFLVTAGQRTDGLARKYTVQSFFNGGNQAETITKTDKLVIAIQGVRDAGVNSSYVKDLLKERCVMFPGGHGLIYTNADLVSRSIRFVLKFA